MSINMENYSIAFRAGQDKARRDFNKTAAIKDVFSTVGGKIDPRWALGGAMATVPMLGVAGHEIMDALAKGVNYEGPVPKFLLDKPNILKALGIGAGGAGAGVSALAGAANPGLVRQSSLPSRLSSEFAAAAQTPKGMAKSLALLLGVPYGIYQAGKMMGKDEATLF